MRWLRALDAATTAFIQELWPVDDCSIGQSDYTVDAEHRVITTDKLVTPENKLKMRDAFEAAFLAEARAENVFEPPLTGDEIVCLRQLIEERFALPSSSTAVPQPGAVEDGPADGRHDPRQPSAGHPFDFANPRQSSAGHPFDFTT